MRFLSALLLIAVVWACPIQVVSRAALPTSVAVEPRSEGVFEHVILISVDGLRPDAVTRSSEEYLPNFYRMRRHASFTDAARTDHDFSNTLPNHVGILTGRGVTGDDGHNWVTNDQPLDGVTLHSNKGGYVASVFDVVHDAGLTTAAYVSKKKFVLFDRSYDEAHGAPDEVGSDDGKDKLDVFVIEQNTELLVDRLIDQLKQNPAALTFLHLGDPDAAGHRHTWSLRSGSRYMSAVRHVDRLIGRLLNTIANDAHLASTTGIVLTADHGGSWWSHGNQTSSAHSTVPFYLWGSAIMPGDLYAQIGNGFEPTANNPSYAARVQPIRNANAANVSLSLLGLPPVPGSTVPTFEPPIRPTEQHASDQADAASGRHDG